MINLYLFPLPKDSLPSYNTKYILSISRVSKILNSSNIVHKCKPNVSNKIKAVS